MCTDSSHNPALLPKVRCYGSRAALTVEASPLIHKGAPVGWTLNLDVAPKNGDSVQWQRKITVQLSETELPLFAGVCLGYLPRAEFRRATKGIIIERQPNRLFVSATQGRCTGHALPVSIAQAFQIGALALHQLTKQTPLQNSHLLLAALRGACALFSPST